MNIPITAMSLSFLHYIAKMNCRTCKILPILSIILFLDYQITFANYRSTKKINFCEMHWWFSVGRFDYKGHYENKFTKLV